MAADDTRPGLDALRALRDMHEKLHELTWDDCEVCGVIKTALSSATGDSRPRPDYQPEKFDNAGKVRPDYQPTKFGDISEQPDGLTLGEDGRYHCGGCDAHDID